MKIEYKNINEALNFYNITDEEYKNKCYQCIENINKNNEILNKFNDIYKLLYEDKTDEYRKLWKIKNPKGLFGQDCPIFSTNILLLLGYRCHIKNIEKITFDNEQITIQKQRVKELIEVSEELKNEYYKKFIGKSLEVLVETYSDGYLIGHLSNYGKVKFKGDESLLHNLVMVKLNDYINDEFMGGLIKEEVQV